MSHGIITAANMRTFSYIPNGTYPEERLVDGAIGAVEDAPEQKIRVGLESSLDFDSAWPLIYPQGTVLFQEDDEWYETHGDYNGFWNSTPNSILTDPRSTTC